LVIYRETHPARGENTLNAKECTIEEFAAAYEQGAFVVDIREPFEYADGHVPGAESIPMGQLGARLGEVPADGAVYVICATGNRSRWSASELEDAGRLAYSVKGGTMAWARSGRPVVTGMNAR
jgi:rhodanese-related sulfurtransferase